MTDALESPFQGSWHGERPVWWDWTQGARLRRRQLGLSIMDLRRPIPYARFCYYVAWVLFLLNFFVLFWNWVFHFLEQDFLWFVAFMAANVSAIVAWWMHSLVQRWWPQTTKWVIGDAPEIPVKEWKPGEFVRTAELPKTPDPVPAGSPDPTTKERIPVELALGGNAVENLPFPRKRKYLMIALAQYEGQHGLQAGIIEGKRYRVPCKPELYVAWDLPNWRGYDWYALGRTVFGSRVTRDMIIVLALDAVEDPKGAKPPGDRQVLRNELYEAQQRNRSLEAKSANWMARDEGRARTKSRTQDYERR